ncbi:MAG TPA: hypothetical protein VFK90_11135, partial [Anaeromyxobacter sp.]|nr:hypothetical protein [Anaeromyxobacter sp.]
MQGTPLRLIADAGLDRAPGASPTRPAPARSLGILAPVAALVIFALGLLRATSEERALTKLPPAERAAVVQRTLDNLRSVCAGERGRELRDFCRGQAQLVLPFPECDAACQ